jgi:hypothetical protein
LLRHQDGLPLSQDQDTHGKADLLSAAGQIAKLCRFANVPDTEMPGTKAWPGKTKPCRRGEPID